MTRLGWISALTIMIVFVQGCGKKSGPGESTEVKAPPTSSISGGSGTAAELAKKAQAEKALMDGSLASSQLKDQSTTQDVSTKDTAAPNKIGLTYLDIQADKGADKQSPSDITNSLLKALMEGNVEAATMLLTSAARNANQAEDGTENPFFSQGARQGTYEIGRTKMLSEVLAHVESKWHSGDEKTGRSTEDIIWALRLEQGGWRVAGALMTVSQLQNRGVALNFENAEEMKQLLEQIPKEIRAQQRQTTAAKGNDAKGNFTPENNGAKRNNNEVGPK